MPEISSLTRPKPIEASVTAGDETVNVVFDANKVTPRWLADAQERLEQREALALSRAVSEAMIGWDVTDDGSPYPPTAENIGRLSFPAIEGLFDAICEAAIPSSAEGNASPPSSDVPLSGTSGQTSETSLNGSATSPSPTSSESALVR